MATKRTPINRSPITQVTPRAIELFDAMRRCGGRRWWELQNALCDELHTPIWQYPCIEDPRDGENRPAAEALWRMLDAASREARRQEREARRAQKAAKGAPDQTTPPPG